MLRHSRVCLVLAFLVAGCAASVEGIESCREETLVGSWKTTWLDEYWTFAPDGSLLCEGPCSYGAGVGSPQGWADDASANLWSGSFEYLKLIFTEKTFEGSLGAYRCQTLEEGTALRLKPFKGPDLDFTRAAGG